MPDWQATAGLLRGERPYRPEPMARPVAAQVPPRERRRHTFSIALAMTCAMQAIEGDEACGEMHSVFACSGGDTDVIDHICNALLLPGRPVSPQQFLNSVHNAPAGYWSIASKDTAAAASLSAYDATFAAGLIEAAVQIRTGQDRILLVAYDVPPPEPIWRFRPLTAPFAVAMLLAAPDTGHRLARLEIALDRTMSETRLAMRELEDLRCGNPAARSLPLLDAIARGRPGVVCLPYLEPSRLCVEVAPC